MPRALTRALQPWLDQRVFLHKYVRIPFRFELELGILYRDGDAGSKRIVGLARV